MPDKESGKPSRPPRTAQTTPEDYPTTSSGHPSGDYSYTVELVGTIQHTLGKLTEAVESLKGQSKGHGEKLEQIGKDVHAAKVLLGFCGAAIVAVGTVASLLIKALLDYYVRLHAK